MILAAQQVNCKRVPRVQRSMTECSLEPRETWCCEEGVGETRCVLQLSEGGTQGDCIYVFVKSTSGLQPVGFVLWWATLWKSKSPMFFDSKVKEPWIWGYIKGGPVSVQWPASPLSCRMEPMVIWFASLGESFHLVEAESYLRDFCSPIAMIFVQQKR